MKTVTVFGLTILINNTTLAPWLPTQSTIGENVRFVFGVKESEKR